MRPVCSASMVFLVLGVIAGGVARGQPRDPPLLPSVEPVRETAAQRRDRKVVQMGAWMRRVPGRYQFSGTMRVPDFSADQWVTTELVGLLDCAAIGAGPGLHCILVAGNRRDEQFDELTGRVSDFRKLRPPRTVEGEQVFPFVFELGMERNTPKFRLQISDHLGFAEEGSGYLYGDHITVKARCPNVPAIPPCEDIIRITAPPVGDRLRMYMESHRQLLTATGRILESVELDLELKLLPEDSAGLSGERVRAPKLPPDDDQQRSKSSRSGRRPR